MPRDVLNKLPEDRPLTDDRREDDNLDRELSIDAAARHAVTSPTTLSCVLSICIMIIR